MKVLVVGSGGREHALCWQMAQSDRCTALFVAPGNAGMEECARRVAIAVDDLDGLVDFAVKSAVDLVVVGPEMPLVLGLTDRLRALNIPGFGPTQAAAQMEGSKAYMKDFCLRHNIPTASYRRFTNAEVAKAYILNQTSLPIVVKADGLAAGKGVIIAETHEEAIEAAQNILSGASFGAAGREIVIEAFLDGEEISYFAIADGKSVIGLASAQDHKRAFDGDKGPNTGGMGAYSPARLMTPALEQEIMETIIQPTIAGMQAEGTPFTGILFAGLMVQGGKPTLLEYNTRSGDPECQSIMMRFRGDLLEVLWAAATGNLDRVRDHMIWHDEPSVCVVMAANGYPAAYEKNTVIRSLNQAANTGAKIFHAGTERTKEGEIIAIGGRVLGITARAPTLSQARDMAYETIDTIQWPEGFCRRDIGWRAMG